MRANTDVVWTAQLLTLRNYCCATSSRIIGSCQLSAWLPQLVLYTRSARVLTYAMAVELDAVLHHLYQGVRPSLLCRYLSFTHCKVILLTHRTSSTVV
jgi:hypothetical protein